MKAAYLSVRHVRAQGARSGPPVLLLHGFASRGAVDWPDALWALPLAAIGRDVLVVDLPGHGGSPRPASPPRASEVVEAIAEVVLTADTGAGPAGAVDIVGYSLGARLAWELAGMPSLATRRLVLGGLSPREPFGAVDVAAARAAQESGAPPDDGLTAMIVAMCRMPGNDPDALLDIVEGLAAEPFDPSVSPPAIPTLVLAGSEDPLASGIDGVVALLPDASFAPVPGDHLGALHGPQLQRAVFEFLTR